MQLLDLPANLFYNTSIPTCIIVLKKAQRWTGMYYLLMRLRNLNKGKKQNDNDWMSILMK